MKKTTLVATALATVFTASSAFAWWGDHDKGEHGRKSAGCSREYREHKGGKGHHAMKGQKFREHMNRELSAAEVKTLQEARLIYQNNPNIKVGEVTATDSGYKVTIVTQDNSLVGELNLAKNGMRLERFEAVQKRMESRKTEEKQQ